MSRLATTPDEFMDLLRSRHGVMMVERSESHPGEFKERPDQAGGYIFVLPTLVEGTLIEGFDRIQQLDTAWERSLMTMWVVAEVHPFVDGNGRMARIAMNAELHSAGLSRNIIRSCSAATTWAVSIGSPETTTRRST